MNIRASLLMILVRGRPQRGEGCQKRKFADVGEGVVWGNADDINLDKTDKI